MKWSKLFSVATALLSQNDVCSWDCNWLLPCLSHVGCASFCRQPFAVWFQLPWVGEAVCNHWGYLCEHTIGTFLRICFVAGEYSWAHFSFFGRIEEMPSLLGRPVLYYSALCPNEAEQRKVLHEEVFVYRWCFYLLILTCVLYLFCTGSSDL